MIQLPKDAEGREIPLDTEVLYTDDDGSAFHVDSVEYVRMIGTWCFEGHRSGKEHSYSVMSSCLHLTPPDSWSKLLDDLDRSFQSTSYTPCAYFQPACGSCDKCFADPDNNCVVQMFEHIESRIRKLRGEDDA